MLTLFTIPKSFESHNALIQRNALNSWLRLRPACEIILCGNDPGVAEAAAEFGVSHLPNVTRNEYGTPLLNSAFDQVREVAKHSLLCYINADIILLDDFVPAVQRIEFAEFLMVGQRWNLDVTKSVDFDQSNWRAELNRRVNEGGVLEGLGGIDYFVFHRESALGELPPFAVGRAGWDNWFIYNARRRGVPVIDATRVVMAIHQNHSYNHVPQQRGKKWYGPESDQNFEIIGNRECAFCIGDATHVITTRGLSTALSYKYLRQRWLTLPVLYPRSKLLIRILNPFFWLIDLGIRFPRAIRRRLKK